MYNSTSDCKATLTEIGVAGGVGPAVAVAAVGPRHVRLGGVKERQGVRRLLSIHLTLLLKSPRALLLLLLLLLQLLLSLLMLLQLVLLLLLQL
jgi:hypothetical protein